MVRHRDDDRVNIWRSQNIVIIMKCFYIYPRLALIRVILLGHGSADSEPFPLGIQITYCDDARERFSHDISQIIAAHAATTDLGNLDFLVRRIRPE